MAYNYEYPYTDPNLYNDDWLLKKMKELIAEWGSTTEQWDDMKVAFQNLKDFAEQFFDELNVQEEVNKKLDNMYESGELEILIAPYMKDAKFSASRLFRVIARQETFQSIAFTGSTYFVLSNTLDSSRTIVIRELGLNGDLMRTQNLTGGNGHPNGCAYKDGKLYILDTYGQKLYKADYYTLAVETTIDLSGHNYAGLSLYADELYFYNGSQLDKLVGETPVKVIALEISSAYRYFPEPMSLSFQGFTMYKGYAYIWCNLDNQYIKVSLETGKVAGYYKIGEGNGIFPYGEIEGGVVVNDQIYIVSQLYARTLNRYTDFVCEIFATNIGRRDIDYIGFSGEQTPNERVCYVNVANNLNNPDGLTSGTAFSSLDEACMVLSYQFKFGMTITMNIAPGDYGTGVLKFNNINLRVDSTGTVTCDTIDLHAFSGSIRNIKTTSETVYSNIQSSNITLLSCSGKHINIRRSIAHLYDVTNGIDLDNSAILGTCNLASIDNGSVYEPTPYTSSLYVDPSSPKTVNWNADTKVYLSKVAKTKQLYLSFKRDTQYISSTLYLTPADATTLDSGETLSYDIPLTVVQNNDTYIVYMKIQLTKDHINIQEDRAIKVSTGGTLTMAVYFMGYSLK